METMSIEIYHGVRVNHNHELIYLDYIPDIWKLFGWDIENDAEAKEASLLITRELFCFGFIDLTQMADGKLLTIELLPPEEKEALTSR